MGDHFESIIPSVCDAGVSRLIGHAMRLMHEKPSGSGDVDSPISSVEALKENFRDYAEKMDCR